VRIVALSDCHEIGDFVYVEVRGLRRLKQALNQSVEIGLFTDFTHFALARRKK
jgi:hypothetical protein